ncbi:Yip1 family protein [Sphingomonas mali]|uniref:Yip1 family protein n=1 Tax=Sphingomonas mali TaxID=40682 RepID=UPI00082FC9ED|nr:Yip1 family protein [Sphingomonas mali]
MASEFPKDIGQPPVGGGGMIGRVQRLMLKPKDEWPAIDAEPMTVQGILMGWVAPLAAIGPVAHLIQGQVFPMNFFGVTWRPPLIGSIVTAILAWALTIGLTYVWALIIDALAPSFGGTKNPISALKVAAFSATAGWIAAVLGILPALGIIGSLIGLYNIYLFWIGGPMLMKVPQDKAVGFVVVSIIVGVVAMVVAGIVAIAIGGAMFAMTPNAFGPGGGGTISVGGTTLDTGKLTDAATKMEAASKSMEASIKGGDGAVKAVDPGALQNLLPASISGWNRTSVENQGGGAAGIGGSNARAEFQSGDQNFSLSVTDTGVLGNIATLGGAINASSNKQTTTGYEKSEMQGGNMVSEKWDNQSKSGSYSVLVASRFAVEASGSAPSIDTLKSAVAAVDLGQLQSMAK